MPREFYSLPATDDINSLRFELQRILDDVSRRLNFISPDGSDINMAGRKFTNLEQGTSGTDSLRVDQTLLLTALASVIRGTAHKITVVDNGNNTITLTLPGTIQLDGATASRLLATDSNKRTVSVANLASWIAGTLNRLTVIDDGDGTITIDVDEVGLDHDLLDNLATGDEHTQYLPLSGIRAMLADLNFGGFKVVNVGAANLTILSGTADPTAGSGIAATVPALYARNNSGVGELYLKFGAADTDWRFVLHA